MTPPNKLRRLTDQQVVELALEGEQRAYGELVRRYQNKVFEENLQMVHDWDVADSLTQHTFVRAFRGLDGYKADFQFAAWLLRIARNAALDRLRKRKVATMPIEGSPLANTPETFRYPALQVSARGGSPLQEVLSREADGQLRLALADLRPAYREAVLLRAEQLPYQEIARRMGVPINTVSTYISRAREKLKQALKEEV